MNIIVGIIIDITLFTNKLILVKSLFALSNLFSSYFSVANALITGNPVRISLDTKLTLSSNSCTFLKLGTATKNRTNITARIATSATPITHAIELSLTFKKAPIPIIGAYTTTLISITISICICCISLVVLVIRELALNLSNSSFEKLITFLTTLLLNSLANALDNLLIKYELQIVINADTNVIPNIFKPVLAIYFICTFSILSPTALYSSLTLFIAYCFTTDSPILSILALIVSMDISLGILGLVLLVFILFICSITDKIESGVEISFSIDDSVSLLTFSKIYNDSFLRAG